MKKCIFFKKLQNSIKKRIKTLKNIIHSDQKIKKLEERIALLERNDEYLRLRSVSNTIGKQNLIVYVGTGRLGENALYAYLHMHKYIIENEIQNIEALYISRSQTEEDFLKKLNIPFERWNISNVSLILKVIQAKVAVFSTHTFCDNESNSLLTSCLSGAIKIQLWHGFLAKVVGCGMLTNDSSLHTLTNLIEDCSVNVVTTPLINEEIRNMYQSCFPGAQVLCLGDPRSDFVINEKQVIEDSVMRNAPPNLKIIVSPTYRESKEETINYLEMLLSFVQCAICKNGVEFNVKFHPIFFRDVRIEDKNKYFNKFSNLGIKIINENEDSYTILNNYDAMITDYSSIRFDFLVTGKPIFLFRPDFKEYTFNRKINPFMVMNEIDNYLYEINECSNVDLVNIIKYDSKKNERISFIKKLNMMNDGNSCQRVTEYILHNVVKHNQNA